MDDVQEATTVEAADEDKLTAEALKNNVDAAFESAELLRMEAKGGTAAERKLDARRLTAHMREVAHILEHAKKSVVKKQKPELKKLIKEIETVQKELASHPEV